MEYWTKELSNDNHQIVVATDGDIVTRHIFNQPTTPDSKNDALLIESAPSMYDLLIEIIDCQYNNEKNLNNLNNAVKNARDFLLTKGITPIK